MGAHVRVCPGGLGNGADFLQPGQLLWIRLLQAAKQLPGFGFELAYEGEITFRVPVCRGLLFSSAGTPAVA